MPVRDHYIENGDQAAAGAHNLLSMIGNTKHLTSGWVGFAIKSLVTSSASATVFGLASWMLLQGPAGPALSFLGGAGFGFIGGLVSRWRTDAKEALHLANEYPRLIEYHLRLSEAGRELEGRSFAEWTRDLQWNPRKQGMAIVAIYSAAPALERIRQEQEEALIAAYAEGLAGSAADDGLES